MKLLIISGPYEADRLRKAAVSAGFEAVAVEPGESLSGGITASRPALVIMAGLADGFFIRPVAPEELLERARAVLNAAGGGNGAPRARVRTGENAATPA